MRTPRTLPQPDRYERSAAVQPLYRHGSELDSRVGEVLASDELWVPAGIEGKGEELRYEWIANREQNRRSWPTKSEARSRELMKKLGLPRVVRPGVKILEQFVELADDIDGEGIALFARRWGILNLCEHGYPA